MQGGGQPSYVLDSRNLPREPSSCLIYKTPIYKTPIYKTLIYNTSTWFCVPKLGEGGRNHDVWGWCGLAGGLCGDRDQGRPPALAKLGGTKRRVGDTRASEPPMIVTPSHHM